MTEDEPEVMPSPRLSKATKFCTGIVKAMRGVIADPIFYRLCVGLIAFASFYLVFYVRLPNRVGSRLNNQDYFFGGNGINIEISNNFEWAKSSEDVLTRVLKLVGDNSKLFDKVTSPDNEDLHEVEPTLANRGKRDKNNGEPINSDTHESGSDDKIEYRINFEENKVDDFNDEPSSSSRPPGSEAKLDSLLDFRDILFNFNCTADEDLPREEKRLMKIQHHVSKELFSITHVGERFRSCENYFEAMGPFLERSKKPKIPLAFVHNITWHVDVGLFEMFLLTYGFTTDFHCIDLNPELSGETLTVLKRMVRCYEDFAGFKVFLAKQNTPVYWKSLSAQQNSGLNCMRELLEKRNGNDGWKYMVAQSRHSLPLYSRFDLERLIVDRITGFSYETHKFNLFHHIGVPFKPPAKDGNIYILPDDHVIDIDDSYGNGYIEWPLEDAFISWDLANYIVNDLTYTAMRKWLKQSNSQQNESTFVETLVPSTEIQISAMVESSMETSKRFILQRYLAPGESNLIQNLVVDLTCIPRIDYKPEIKRNDYMRVCAFRSNTLWWNSAFGGCPPDSDKKWCFLRQTDLYRAYDLQFKGQDDCLFSNRFSVGSHPTTAICHALKMWYYSR